MDKMTQILDIPSIKNDTNFWMVRAKRGFFFDEFIRNEFIAIGWNSVTKAMISQNLTRSQSDRLKASMEFCAGKCVSSFNMLYGYFWW